MSRIIADRLASAARDSFRERFETFGYALSKAAYTGKSFDASAQGTAMAGIHFNPTGTRLFAAEVGVDIIFQYNLTSPYDLSTASYSGKSINVGAQDGSPWGVRFNPEGTKMFMLGSGVDAVFEYNLTTAFEIDTASYSGNSFSVAGEDSSPLGFSFSKDGTKMYVTGSTGDNVYEYSLTTGFDITTAGYTGRFLDVSAQDTVPFGVLINDFGTKLFVSGDDSDSVHEYSLTTPFDVSTASYAGISFNTSNQGANPRGITFSDNGDRLFAMTAEDAVHEYITGATILAS